MARHPLDAFLSEMATLRSTHGTKPELSYYPPLANLLNAVGESLAPSKVICVTAIKDEGADDPDAGLYSEDQLDVRAQPLRLTDTKPSRGVVEVKSLAEDLTKVAGSQQVLKYWRAYQQVFVTNYREFRLVTRSPQGKISVDQGVQLADSEEAFWELATKPKQGSAKLGDELVAYLAMALSRTAALTEPRDVASQLASYARQARRRLEQKANLPALQAVRGALQDVLGLEFAGESGEHFFRSTLVQTLFYGMFSAWVIWSRNEAKKTGGSPASPFTWRGAEWYLRVPMVQALYEQVAKPTKLEGLGITSVLDWAQETLGRVDREAFFELFAEEKAIQYFYEPFLEAFDPDLRKELGVWYTPREVARYMVERVDQALREELQVKDGLADPSVYVLDPCCGTGTFLLEVLRKIEDTLAAQHGADALIAQDLKKVVTSRLFGFELLPAPYVVAHLQIGLFLQDRGAPFQNGHERAAIYLTNSLTGWNALAQKTHQVSLPELADERDAAEKVKIRTPILVVLGNPPYNAYAGVSSAEEEQLVDVYKDGLVKTWKIRKFNLDDLYIRFFRVGERRITEQTGRGIVCYISNFSYLREKSFVVMRKRFLEEFNGIWIDSLNGDSRETGKRTPNGKPDPSIFSTAENPQGIRKGTAIGLLVRKGTSAPGSASTVHIREFWGAGKREQLLRSLISGEPESRQVHPDASNLYRFRSLPAGEKYKTWPRVVELALAEPMNGLMEKRGGALISINKSDLEQRMLSYFNDAVTWAELADLGSGLTKNAARFNAAKARKKLLATEHFDASRLLRYALRPFDTRWCYYSGVRPLWNEPRPKLKDHLNVDNEFFVTRPAAVASPEGVPAFYTKLLGDNDFLRGHAYYFPILTRPPQASLPPKGKSKKEAKDATQLAAQLDGDTVWIANLSVRAKQYLRAIGCDCLTDPMRSSQLVWLHALAISFAPEYLEEHADGLAEDWPRIPLPSTIAVLEASATIGRKVAALLDGEASPKGLTSGVPASLARVAVLTKVGGGALGKAAKELSLTTGWGHRGADGAVMPGGGKAVSRPYEPAELEALRSAVQPPLTVDEVRQQLGSTTVDVYVNDMAYWKNIPEAVWGLAIGGFRPLKKWLSYREESVLGRPLTADEAREVSGIARTLTALALQGLELDENYAAVAANPFRWATTEEAGKSK